MNTFAQDERLDHLKRQLREHPLYDLLRGPRPLRCFLRHHVYCVWDFMSLLKALQGRLTCVTIPWLPTPDPVGRRLINEIVLGEESDDDGAGGHLSHFELYLAAMADAGAWSPGPVLVFLGVLRAAARWTRPWPPPGAPPVVAAFVRQTLRAGSVRALHWLAAAFALGREDVIPALFVRLLEGLARAEPGRYARLLFYLRRHVELDGDSHGPAALRLLTHACGDDPVRRREALDTAALCLEARLRLWDAITAAVKVGE